MEIVQEKKPRTAKVFFFFYIPLFVFKHLIST